MVFLINFLYADNVKEMSIACPDMQELLNIPKEVGTDYVKLNAYAISKNCLFLMPGDTVKVIDYDPNKKTRFIKIETNARIMYMQTKSVLIEQPGSKNIIKF